LVKQPHGYYYDANAIRSDPRKSYVKNGAVVSATGVRGVRYRRQIELSTALSPAQKQAAFLALDDMLQQLAAGRVGDFRLIIRGQQRTTHSDAERVSGRARELRERGFYFLRYHPAGTKPSDVWDILPEDTQRRSGHFSAYPEDLCKIPILATCPPDGIVLDPFAGTGTTMLVACKLGRKSLGIDVSETYLQQAEERCRVASLNPGHDDV
jgi:site-specific DNA-methyltransferase (adenine-specific)